MGIFQKSHVADYFALGNLFAMQESFVFRTKYHWIIRSERLFQMWYAALRVT